jgi:hypothetical protein
LDAVRCVTVTIAAKKSVPEAGTPFFLALVPLQAELVSTMTVPFAKLVRIKCSAASASQGANRRALFAAGKSTNSRTTKRGPGDCQFVSMFLPESAMAVAITSLVRRGNRLQTECQRQEHQRNRQQLFHFAKCHSILLI